MLKKFELSDSVWRGMDRFIVGRIIGFTGGLFVFDSNVGSVGVDNIVSTSVSFTGVVGVSSVFGSDFFKNSKTINYSFEIFLFSKFIYLNKINLIT